MIDRLGQGRAHDGELQQVLGRAIDIGAQVEHGRGAPGLVGDGRGNSRTVDAIQRLEHVAGNRHPGAGIARRDAGVGAAVLDRLRRQAHGRVFLAAQRDLDRVVHGDDFGRGHDVQAIARRVAPLGQGRLDRVGKPDQQQPGIRKLPGELDRGRNRDGQAEVTAHAVYSDAYHGCQVSVLPRRSGSRVRPRPYSSALVFRTLRPR